MFARKKSLRLSIDVLELSVAIRVLVPLGCLPVALKAVFKVVQKLADRPRADLMAHGLQFSRQLRGALRRPAQRRFGVTPRHGIHQRFEVLQQLRNLFRERLTASPGTPNTLVARLGFRRHSRDLVEVTLPEPDPLTADPSGRRHDLPSAEAQSPRFRSSPQPRHTLVHHRAQEFEPQPDTRHLVAHAWATDTPARLFPSNSIISARALTDSGSRLRVANDPAGLDLWPTPEEAERARADKERKRADDVRKRAETAEAEVARLRRLLAERK